MNRTLQPMALILGLILLVGLRLIASYDPLAQTVDRLLRDETEPTAGQTDPVVAGLERRISQLEAELEFKQGSELDLKAAHIISKTSASFRQLIKIDRGKRDGVKPDQAVLSGGYLVGLVENADELSATVILLGDPSLNVPVTAAGAAGVAAAKAGGLVINQLNDNGRARSGQAALTSGLGGLYPPGLPVGSLGARLGQDILSEFVLNRPFNLSQLTLVQVVVAP